MKEPRKKTPFQEIEVNSKLPSGATVVLKALFKCDHNENWVNRSNYKMPMGRVDGTEHVRSLGWCFAEEVCNRFNPKQFYRIALICTLKDDIIETILIENVSLYPDEFYKPFLESYYTQFCNDWIKGNPLPAIVIGNVKPKPQKREEICSDSDSEGEYERK